MALEQALLKTIRELSPQQQQAVLNFARSLQTKCRKDDELREVLAKITSDNLHGEIDFGYAVGQEIG
jgi:antitoxin component of MazEF toxin-antitoxin module